jgi:beta-lactamase superfamily II metal-dependent hydrolase
MSAMTKVSLLATEIPGAFFYVAAPSWPAIAIYYAVIVGALGGGWFARKRRFFSVAILILIAVICFRRWEQSRAETKLTVLPLDGGHSVFVDAAGRKNDWLVDCGNDNAVAFTLKPFLRAQGVNTVPRLVLTEGDLKNCGGAQLLDQLFGIGELWTSGAKFRSSVYFQIISRFEKGGRPQGPSRHKIFNDGDQTGCWRVLLPGGTNHFSPADDNALVLLGNFQGAKILLLSDLGRAGQDELLSRTNDLRADIVVAGLPAEGEPLCAALLDAIQPKAIVIADSEFPANRRASPELKERLARRNVPVIYTRNSGAVTILARPDGWVLQTMDGQKFAGDDVRSLTSK